MSSYDPMIPEHAADLLDRTRVTLPLPDRADEGFQALMEAEWLVTNGLGGYASGTVAGANTRRYHGLLVAALPNPLGRTVMLNHVAERVVRSDGTGTYLGGEERVAGQKDETVSARIVSFELRGGIPTWVYDWNGLRIEKWLFMSHLQNTVWVSYRLADGADEVTLELHPAVHFRSYEAPVSDPLNAGYWMSTSHGRQTITEEGGRYPSLRLRVVGAENAFVLDERVRSEFIYPVEQVRGYEFRGALWAPGYIHLRLRRDETATLVASTETEDVATALTPSEALECERERRRRLLQIANPVTQEPVPAQLVLAADQFLFTPVGRVADTMRAHASGDEIRSVIAGYHWFTDWGRDTMISLDGLTLVTGRWREASFILRTFAHYVRDGLIPNMFPDGSNQGLYHTADATLWFFHAVARYVAITGDERTLRMLLPTLQAIVSHHVAGTHFGIGMDPKDGLLRQGAEGYQLTWMDAKVDGWVVTPRRGKAVEINALWYNALSLLSGWVANVDGEDAAGPLRERAMQARESFNARFWNPQLGYLYDVVDGEKGDSTECRPNQIFAISLDHPVLEESKWCAVLETVRDRLLTPVGLRSLAPGEPDYKPRYYGDLRARDAAYHQGTVWAWLIGPWIDAYLKVHPDQRREARGFLDGLIRHLETFGVGSIAEIFDATEPYTPRGCIAQAWSVAEVLRCWVKTAPADQL